MNISSVSAAVLAFTLLLAADSAAFASVSVSKKKIAVLEITTNDTPVSIANIARNSFEILLFNSDRFQLLDRDRLMGMAMKTGVQPRSASPTADLVLLGSRLSADFLIGGSIDRINQYKITIRVISVENGEIIFAHSREFKDPSEIESVLDVLTDRTIRDITAYIDKGRIRHAIFDTHDILLGVQMHYLSPLMRTGDLIHGGPGIRFSAEADNIVFTSGFAGFSLGYYSFSGAENSSDRMTWLTPQLSAGYRFPLSKFFYLKPCVSAGLNILTLSHKGSEGFDMESGSERIYTDPIGECSLFAGVVIGYALRIEAGAGFGADYEPEGSFPYWTATASISYSF